MEKIKLTARWVVEHTLTNEFELKEGLEIEFYHKNNERIINPSTGTVFKDDNGFYIKWNDFNEDTRLNGDSHCMNVLKNCGYNRYKL